LCLADVYEFDVTVTKKMPINEDDKIMTSETIEKSAAKIIT
jgi:hypothetical protein